MTSAGDHLVDFEAGQLSALAGFSPLRHFDLYLVGVYQIFRVDSESSRGHLLDRTAGRSPVGTRLVTFRVLPPFTRIAASADAIHRYGDRLVCLATDRAVRYSPRYETPHNCLLRLDPLYVDRITSEIKHVAQKNGRVLIVGDMRVLLELGVVSRTGGLLEPGDGLGEPCMVFASFAVFVDTGVFKRRTLHRLCAETPRMGGQRLGSDVFDANSRDRRHSAPEIAVKHFLCQAQCIE